MKMFATLALAAALAVTGCKKEAASTGSAAALKLSTVDQVDQWISADQATPVDANNRGTREHMGVVPGAIKLTSYDKYELSELPSDKSRRLIFYCANTQCGASHEAAERAIAAGYDDVEVMSDGIAGWVNAGKKVEKI